MQALAIDICAHGVRDFGLGMYVKAKLEDRKEWWVTRVAPGSSTLQWPLHVSRFGMYGCSSGMS